MAQLNIRLPDQDKEIAEKVAQEMGVSLSEYLNSVVSYISEHKTLPVVIKFKTESLTPDTIFQQAIVKMRDTYLLIKEFYSSLLKVGDMTPLESLRVVINELYAAIQFYEGHKSTIAMAPCQLEPHKISETEFINFSLSNEHFPYVIGAMKTAIRAINMNNRAVEEEDIAEGETALQSALNHINDLQKMINGNLSTDSNIALLLLDANDALGCAKYAVSTDNTFSYSTWLERMRRGVFQVAKQIDRIGLTPKIDKLMELNQMFIELMTFVDKHVKEGHKPVNIENDHVYINILSLMRELRNELSTTVIK